MKIEKISKTSSVNSGYENFREDRFVNMLIFWDFVAPMGPFIFFDIVVIIIAETALWEFNLYQRPKDSVEFV